MSAEETIRIIIEKESIANIVEIIFEMDLSKQEILLNSIISLNPFEIFVNDIHKKHSINAGKKITIPAIIPKAPTPDFKSFIHPSTVLRESLIIPPIIGTQLFKASFKAFLDRQSPEEATICSRVNILKNAAELNSKIFLKILCTALHKKSNFRLQEKDEIKEIPKRTLINGIIKFSER